ncbi:MAG TPA: 50S ribosomal protein L3 N(5)-glutamine methyltransferase [Steroidobacteraceae bacterium]|jgi:ribosomal protein L3 glutamine methyltransferase|nr:50S ribosomal protein L3 N(5)-glutamine methyltransferase [Steroidobacteraceae bacterium]
MPRLLHREKAVTVGQVLTASARRLARARLHYGHGTERARDDAAALIWHVLRLPRRAVGPAAAALLRRRVPAAARARIEALLQRRMRERVPVVYLTRRCWFAGLSMYVDERVLIPRSPIAELIERRFAPWVQAARVRRILDLGTGSGCIAIACARAFARARVDAVDISPDALAVARINIRRHRLDERVRARASDHFGALRRARYDIIVSNPPYVGERELQGLPGEYRHEPRLALAAGQDGLDSVRIILRDAAAHLNPAGVLIVEVGNSEGMLRRAFPHLPFVWLAFERGGGGVFLLERAQLSSGVR